MSGTRIYRLFVHHEACFHIFCERFDEVAAEIVRQRRILEEYLRRHPRFGTSLTPVDPWEEAPEVARRMASAARRAGTGPMAAVAGAMAQLAAEAGISAGAGEAIVENGGDVFLVARLPVTIGLYAGATPVGGRLAFAIEPADTPLAVCSSSGRMGPSLSLGTCDLATVVATDGALADAAATQAANRVRSEDDLNAALKDTLAIEGVSGVLLVKGGRVGLMGRLPELIRNPDAA